MITAAPFPDGAVRICAVDRFACVTKLLILLPDHFDVFVQPQTCEVRGRSPDRELLRVTAIWTSTTEI